MKVKFWGVRGSIATPGPSTVRYGGNTTCIEIRNDEGDLIILDGGTGIHALAQSLKRDMPLTANIFITHTHWDHIQGLPFFIPIFIAGNRVRLHGGFEPVGGKSIEQALTVQLQHSYFPVTEVELKAEIEYVTLNLGEQTKIGSAVITPVLMNHPVLNFGYRIDCNGKSLFFTGDHEPDGEKDSAIIEAIRGVDILIADTSYTPEEYPEKKGWGHGTFDSSIELAKQAGVRQLYCTHHEPTRTDDKLEKAFEEALLRHPRSEGDPQYVLAREGLELIL